ncbi:extracellular solute-binding protein [Collimonas silvisoli]|uniref:extracellular solute-binding protein n=1 Tax=Collimonas silvisoli TaxID=2825884 RepID=UPI001B8CC58C|nr:extracellular solute-binding protein [Collimonas silvisoli]
MHGLDRYAAITIVDKLLDILRSELGEAAQGAWPILSALLRNFLSGRHTTITALADLSGLPRSSARRIIFGLKAQGWLQLPPMSAHSNRAQVTPSALLLDRLDSITGHTIKLLVDAVDTQSFDRFNAVTLNPAADIAWPRPAASGFDAAVELTLVAYADPVFDIIKQNRADVERFLGMRLRILTYPQDTYRPMLDAALAPSSSLTPAPAAPVLVAIPFPWLAESCRDGRLLDLQMLEAGGQVSGADFYDAVWRAGWCQGRLYGMPIQPTLDFLWYRQDLFDAEGLSPPRCFEDVIECARVLHRPSRARAGITWSAAPGLPIAETFLQILGAQGALSGDAGVLMVDTEAGRRVCEYLRALLPYSQAQLRSAHWVRSAQIFGRGQAAMCYGWSNRHGMLDSHALLQKGGRIGLQLHPTFAPGMTPISPLGGALLAIPSSSHDSAAQRAWKAIETLTSPELMKYFVLHGAAGNARYSVAEDRYVLQRNRVIGVMGQLAEAQQIQAFPAPALPHYHAVIQILSDHLEALLFDTGKDVSAGLGRLQTALTRSHRAATKGPVKRQA